MAGPALGGRPRFLGVPSEAVAGAFAGAFVGDFAGDFAGVFALFVSCFFALFVSCFLPEPALPGK